MTQHQIIRHTSFDLDTRLETPVLRINCVDALAEPASPKRQAELRDFFELPGIVVVDGVMPDHVLAGLREGLSSVRRNFKDKFNQGSPDTPTFKSALEEAGRRLTQLAATLFNYALVPAGKVSYRPMISENEPLHFDTYHVDCGQISLMSVLNFDIKPRLWQVGYNFREVCTSHRKDVQNILSGMPPNTSPSVPLRTAGLQGIGPLREGAPVHKIAFAPNAVWFANPKTISHQILYGNGALFRTWEVEVPNCGCQKCLLKQAEISVPEIT